MAWVWFAGVPQREVAVDRGTFTDTFTYDENGNMTCRTESGVVCLQTYNAENRIASITKLASGTCDVPNFANATEWDFAYDGDGVRTEQLLTPYDASGLPQTAVITRYYFGGAVEITDGAVKKYYSFAGQMIAMRDSIGLKYFLSDQLGSTSVVLDASGNILEQQRYLPFGAPRNMPPYAAVTSTDCTYTGQRDIIGTGLMDYKARFYDPYINRFLQPDTLIPDLSASQSWNKFSYTLNNPIRFNDPTGHRVCEDETNSGCRPAPTEIKVPHFVKSPVDKKHLKFTQWFGPTEFAYSNGKDWNYDKYCQGYHCGIDFGADWGDPVYAGIYGQVYEKPGKGVGGYQVVVQTGNYFVLYQALDGNFQVKEGDYV